MDGRKVFLLVGALIVAAITAFMARSLIYGASAPNASAAVETPKIDGPEVLVATRALPVGTILDATALKFQPWPKELVENAYYLKASTDLKSLQGTVVRNPITAGQPVTQGALRSEEHTSELQSLMRISYAVFCLKKKKHNKKKRT